MHLKKILRISFLFFCLTILQPSIKTTAAISSNQIGIIKTEEEPSEHAKALLIRLFEIRDMNKDGLSSSEKKVLRKELRGMKKEMKASGGLDSKVYISVGAIILILLLIIILR